MTQDTTITINLANGIKGGVGKSVWARMLCAYFGTKGMPYLGYEANQDTPDLGGFYPDIIKGGRIFEFTKERYIDAPNLMVANLLDQRVHGVVNMPGAVSSAFDSWVSGFNVFDTLLEDNAELINWFVTTGDPDSIDPLQLSIERYGANMRHIIVRNENFPNALTPFPTQLTQLIETHKIPVINLPVIYLRAQNFALTNQMPYEDAIDCDVDASFGKLDRSALRGILNKCFASIDSTNIFSSPAPVKEAAKS
jgi:hypothetical protein